MNDFDVLGLIITASVLIVGGIVLYCVRKRNEKRNAAADRWRNTQIRTFESDGREFLKSDDRRVQVCGEFIVKTAERADHAAICHVHHRADALVKLLHVVRFHAMTLGHFPHLDTPHGKFTTRLLMGIELVCSGRHESGAGELAALSQNECVPMVIQRCALRAWLISVDMRAA